MAAGILNSHAVSRYGNGWGGSQMAVKDVRHVEDSES
ncbi:hypothetical protein CTS44_13084 [Comamonas thiooxydans]|nr:hypothetical protein CTS44_13084 [Comamonas thiooxydans]EHN63910.1 hypothetical protein CTATCC11996_20329 [Comamonas testosteroni ATCC 11996]